VPLQQPEEVGLASALGRRGIVDVTVVPIQRTDWLQVLRGVLDWRFLRGEAQPDGPAFSWYLRAAKASVEQAVAQRQQALQATSGLFGSMLPTSSDARVVLVGHSAGGWLARALCLDEVWARQHVRAIVSLGAPHLGPPPDVADQTRGTVANLNVQAPGAFLRGAASSGGMNAAPSSLVYVTVASGRIVGDAAAPPGSAARTAYNSYQMVCGEGDVQGDGIVPLSSAHLDGATQLTLDCFHSLAEPGTARPTDEWYAAEPVIDQWLSTVAANCASRGLAWLGSHPG